MRGQDVQIRPPRSIRAAALLLPTTARSRVVINRASLRGGEATGPVATFDFQRISKITPRALQIVTVRVTDFIAAQAYGRNVSGAD